VRLGYRGDAPRALRAELDSEAHAENLILASAALTNTSLKQVRIYPDVSWSEREARRLALKSTSATELTRRRSVVLRGIPESTSEDLRSQLEHDRAQWAYLKSKISTDPTTIRAAYIKRLPRPAHLSSLKAPRLLRITLASEPMATTLLEGWYSHKREFPVEIRLHPDRPRAVRTTPGDPVVQQPTVVCPRMDDLPTTVDACIETPATTSKNGL
jgi:hypothetical protein